MADWTVSKYRYFKNKAKAAKKAKVQRKPAVKSPPAVPDPLINDPLADYSGVVRLDNNVSIVKRGRRFHVVQWRYLTYHCDRALFWLRTDATWIQNPTHKKPSFSSRADAETALAKLALLEQNS